MLKYSFILVLTIIFLNCFAQSSPKDSILKLLEEHELRDTNRVTLLRNLSSEILKDTVFDDLYTIANEILEISEDLDYAEGKVFGYFTRAWYYEKTDNLEAALNEFKHAKENAQFYKSTRLQYDVFNRIAHFHGRYKNSDSSLYYHQKAYSLVKNSKNSKEANALFRISINYYYRTLFDSSIYYSRGAYNLYKGIYDSAMSRSAVNILAASLKRKGETDSALHYFNIALKYSENSEDKLDELRVYNNIANIYGDRGNYPKALDYYLLTLKAAEEANLDMVKAVTYNNIAIVYYTLNDYAESISYLTKSLHISDSLDDIDNTVNALNNIGELYFKIDSIKKSFEFYNRAERIIEKSDNKFFALYNYQGKGLLYDRIGVPDSALYYLEKALTLSKEIDSKLDHASTNVALAKHYYLKNDYVKSAQYARTGFSYAQEVGSVETIRDAAEVLHEANAKLVKHKDAYKFLKIYTEMNDSLLNQDNTKEITQMEMQYVHDKEIQEIEAQEAIRELERQKEITKQKGLRNAFVVAFILVLFIIVIVVRNVKQKQKANQLLAFQKAEIEEKNEELQQLMSEVSRQKDELEESHNQIKGSIRYAERIQNALLPLEEKMNDIFSDHFIFYKPLEIVSGDFYWVEKVHENVLIAVGDCTGHGVPGAMLSMLGISYLNDIARQPNIVVASQVLEMMRKRVKRALHQTGDVREARDGMDLAFAAINVEEQTLDFAGANNPIIIFRDGELIELEPDRQPISVYQKEEPFNNKVIKLAKSDVLYFFTDGFIDQFSGTTNKKYGSKQFKELLAAIHHEPMLKQRYILKQELEKWMNGTTVQIDDILVAGFKWG
jgi:serine phosphatase RsbU (regulator of sigma subunit)